MCRIKQSCLRALAVLPLVCSSIYRQTSTVPLTQYTTAESRSIMKINESKDTLEDDALLSPAIDPYMPQQIWIYLQYLIPLIAVLVFPLLFAIYVSASGRVPASQGLASFAMSYPQIKGQVLAIVATSLTATTRWAIGGAAALLARKRLLRPRPVYEIDMFFSLRNLSIIWDWKHRRRMMFLTWSLVALCGALTSGFFTLLNPLAIELHTDLSPAREINLAANSDRCATWYTAAVQDNFFSGSAATIGEYTSLSDVPTFLRSMTRQYLTSKNQPNVYPPSSFITTFTELFHTSFVGSTAGALISGAPDLPDVNMQEPPYPLGKPESSSYSMDLQGTWVDVSCSAGFPSLNATSHYQYNVTGAYADYNLTCPGSSILKKGSMRLEGLVILAIDCPLENGTTAIRFLPLSGYMILESMATINCIMSPQIGDVDAVLDPSLQAFNVTRKRPQTSSLSPTAKTLTSLILQNVALHFRHLPIFYYTLPAWGAHSGRVVNEGILLEVTAMTLSALFEFEASHTRHILSMMSKNLSVIPPECVRGVRVVSHERTIGWEMKWTTWLGLLPLVIISIIAFTMIAMAWWSGGKLTVFDPMSPVSLLGAASVGEVVFLNRAGNKTIGDPLDENVLVTRVSYTNRDKTWGLWSSEASSEVNMKRFA